MDFQNNRGFYVGSIIIAFVFGVYYLLDVISFSNKWFGFPIAAPLFIGFPATYLMGYKNETSQEECFWTSLITLSGFLILFTLIQSFNGLVIAIRLPYIGFLFSFLFVFIFLWIGHSLGFRAVKTKIKESKYSDEITLDRYSKRDER